MWKKSEEAVDHLLDCEIVKTLWIAIFSCLGLAKVMLRRVADLFVCWRGLGHSP
jgi:hypothetical protein